MKLILNDVENGESQPRMPPLSSFMLSRCLMFYLAQIEFNYASVNQKAGKSRRKKAIVEDESQPQNVTMPLAASGSKHTQATARQGVPKRRAMPVLEEDDDEEDFDEEDTQLPIREAPEPQTRAVSKPPSKPKVNVKSPTPVLLPSSVTTRNKTFQPLFEPASEDDEPMSLPPTQVRSQEASMQESETPDLGLTIRSTSTRRTTGTQPTRATGTQGSRGTKRKPVVLEDTDESSDGIVTKKPKRGK